MLAEYAVGGQADRRVVPHAGVELAEPGTDHRRAGEGPKATDDRAVEREGGRQVGNGTAAQIGEVAAQGGFGKDDQVGAEVPRSREGRGDRSEARFEVAPEVPRHRGEGAGAHAAPS